MKHIILKSLQLIYFKGIKSMNLNFDSTTTNIFGENGIGKTTIFDAFTWLLFGKDSQGNSDSKFDIKTLNEDNTVIEKVDHEVHAVILMNGRSVKLARIFREKWEKKRGDLLSTFTGHETVCFFDGIPVSITEYNKRVGEIINENLFRIITNPLHFNSLNWKDRRNVIIDMAGEISFGDIFDQATTIQNKGEMSRLISLLNEGKSIEDIKTKTAHEKKTINDQLKQIPTRIDEVRKGMPEAIDFDAISKEIQDHKKSIESIDKQIADKSLALQGVFDANKALTTKINEHKTKQNNIVFKAQQTEQKRVNDANLSRSNKESELRIANSELSSLKTELQRAENDLSIQGKITAKETAISNKQAEWYTENAKEYQAKEGCLICPAYGHECGDDQATSKHVNLKEIARESFMTAKSEKLSSITTEGKELSKQLTQLKTDLATHNSKIEQMKADVDSKQVQVNKLNSELQLMPIETEGTVIKESIAEWVELEKQIKLIEPTIQEVAPVDNSALIESKKTIQSQIDILNDKLRDKATIEKDEKRIAQLLEEEKELAQKVSTLEGDEFAIQTFTKAHMSEIDKRVNRRFKFVKFKLFEKQINGSEIECCEALVDGVPFNSGLNNAARINAGIDIINALCEKNNVSAPVFLDNRESVNKVIETKSQIINLIVSNDKQLTIK